MNKKTLFTKGIFIENPLLIMAMGISPALIGAKTAQLGIVLGICMVMILLPATIIMGLVKKQVTDKTESLLIVVLTGGFAAMIALVMEAYAPRTYEELQIALPVIAINCVIVETLTFYTRNYTRVESFLNSLGTGIGYLLALAVMGAMRELFASGTLWGQQIVPLYNAGEDTFFLIIPGGLLIMACLMAFCNWISNRIRRRRKGVWQ